MSPRADLHDRGEPARADGIRPPGPLEVCAQIAVEHAAGTIAAIEQQRAGGLTARLEDHGKALSDLAADIGRKPPPGSEEDER